MSYTHPYSEQNLTLGNDTLIASYTPNAASSTTDLSS